MHRQRLIMYVGSKAHKHDTVAGSGLTWLGNGAVHAVNHDVAEKLLAYPGVWVEVGQFGNTMTATFTHTYDADDAGTVHEFGLLPGDISIHRLVMKHGDLGDAQTFDLGYEYIDEEDGTDDPDAFFDGVDTGTAAATVTFTGAETIAGGSGVKVIGENIGAAATGQVDLIVEYTFNGNR